MDIQKVELRALSDDQLDAVSGGDKATDLENAQKAAENKAQAAALQGFNQLISSL